MLTINGKCTGVESKTNNKGEVNFYANVLSVDGSEFKKVKVKPETYAKIGKEGVDKPLSLPVQVNAFNNNVYLSEK